MQKTEYLAKISKQFETAKAKAQALVSPEILRPVQLPKPDFDFVPFELPEPLEIENNAHLDGYLTLTQYDKNPNYSDYPLKRAITVLHDDQLKIVLPKRPAQGQICIIDWLHATFKAISLQTPETALITNAVLWQKAIIKNLSRDLQDILGFGISHQLERGTHFYDMTFALEHKAGIVCIGGQADTILIQLSGDGCTFAKHGWQADLHAYLNLQTIEPKITRIDLAHDDVLGDYTSLAWFARQLDIGGFTNGGRMPTVEMLGNWKYPNGKGRTMTVGTRKSSKFCRIYEKGKQLGDKNSNWLRIELELKSKNYFLPLDILIDPSPYFLSAYPCFHIFDHKNFLERQKLERIERQKFITFAKAVEITRHQFGRYVYSFRQEFAKHGLDDKAVLDLLTDIDNKKYPDRLSNHTIPDFFKPKATN